MALWGFRKRLTVGEDGEASEAQGGRARAAGQEKRSTAMYRKRRKEVLPGCRHLSLQTHGGECPLPLLEVLK